MKTLQKRLLAISLIIIIIAISSVNSLIVLADRRPQRDNISLNEVKTVTLYTNTQTYYFTPDESCYYIIETFSNKPTHLKISNVSSTGNIESSGVNAMIEVKSIQSGQWKIYLQFVDKNESEGGEISIQIRKHTLSMFGYSDGSNSSLPDLQVPSEKFNNLYHIAKYENCPNGYESNNYIDITKENGKIVSCVDNRSDYTEILEINENYLTMGIAQSTMVGGEKYTLKRENDEHIVYYNFSGIMTPVKISCATYLNSNYESIIEYDCLNLFNGEKINYSELVGG